MLSKFPAALIFVAALIGATSSLGDAQSLPLTGAPIPTTIIATKPAPGETYGDKPIVTMAVGEKTYKFVLEDGYTDHRKVKWPDVWHYVEQFNPNFVVQGQDNDAFAKIQPGETTKLSGMFAPMDRTFEVSAVERKGVYQQN